MASGSSTASNAKDPGHALLQRNLNQAWYRRSETLKGPVYQMSNTQTHRHIFFDRGPILPGIYTALESSPARPAMRRNPDSDRPRIISACTRVPLSDAPQTSVHTWNIYIYVHRKLLWSITNTHCSHIQSYYRLQRLYTRLHLPVTVERIW